MTSTQNAIALLVLMLFGMPLFFIYMPTWVIVPTMLVYFSAGLVGDPMPKNKPKPTKKKPTKDY